MIKMRFRNYLWGKYHAKMFRRHLSIKLLQLITDSLPFSLKNLSELYDRWPGPCAERSPRPRRFDFCSTTILAIRELSTSNWTKVRMERMWQETTSTNSLTNTPEKQKSKDFLQPRKKSNLASSTLERIPMESSFLFTNKSGTASANRVVEIRWVFNNANGFFLFDRQVSEPTVYSNEMTNIFIWKNKLRLTNKARRHMAVAKNIQITIPANVRYLGPISSKAKSYY